MSVRETHHVVAELVVEEVCRHVGRQQVEQYSLIAVL